MNTFFQLVPFGVHIKDDIYVSNACIMYKINYIKPLAPLQLIYAEQLSTYLHKHSLSILQRGVVVQMEQPDQGMVGDFPTKQEG